MSQIGGLRGWGRGSFLRGSKGENKWWGGGVVVGGFLMVK